ncbi:MULTISPECIES: hypothetical protein [unclassified Kitasatospora]|uniref:hypothetical protein n=1 Tax=unclassified Kitasatospora TaxID=2633591 RepID=UPI00070C2D90|nr:MULTISPECIES: hypothetical protein [unclassified Kitasatospora]KQV13945.1 hypothetical protein ASC99_32400 [Kitasatospora sp. Root107]KRB68931.1 hypothetical protein ASE03_28975 [Kitasatospora sp. Root187]
MTTAPSIATTVPGSAKLNWLLGSYTWRRSAYALAALPVGLVSLPLALVGRSATTHRLQRGLAVRLLDAPIGEPARGSLVRTLAHSVLALPLQLLAAGLTGVLWADVLVRGLCYPLAEWGNDVSKVWGGPTMAGAWAAHFAVGVLTLAILLPLVRLLTNGQSRLAVRLLGTGSKG